MKLIVALFALLAMFAGCTHNTGVKPADGPAPTPTTSASPTSAQVSDTPNFHQKYVYPDGLTVEITKIVPGKVSAAMVEQTAEQRLRQGQDYARFTLRLKNEGTERINFNTANGGGAFGMVSYGPEGEESFTPEFEATPVRGVILPGKAKSSETTWIIPRKYWNDVVMEVNIVDATSVNTEESGARDPIVFAGPIP